MKTKFGLLLLLFFSLVSWSQQIEVSGVVTAASDGLPLPGVSVIVNGTSRGVTTDLDGKYTINDVEPGTYSIVVSYISFTKQTITGVEVLPGETVKLDVTLQPESELLEEVVVTATAVLNNEAGLLAQRQKSIAFSDAWARLKPATRGLWIRWLPASWSSPLDRQLA